MKAHKHAEVIKAWAEGEEIEFLSTVDGVWRDAFSPNWHESIEFRVKPKNSVIAKDKVFDLHFRCYTNHYGKIEKVEVLNG